MKTEEFVVSVVFQLNADNEWKFTMSSNSEPAGRMYPITADPPTLNVTVVTPPKSAPQPSLKFAVFDRNS